MPIGQQPIETLAADLMRASAELECLVRSGERCACERVLLNYPQLATDHDHALELIYLEYLIRTEAGDAPRAVDFASRFPELRNEVLKLLQVDESMRGSSLPTLSSGAIVPLPDQKIHDLRSNADLPGQMGDYMLLEVIGRGGMGCVYKAVQKSLSRLVAVKTVDALASFNPSAVARFKAEAEFAARLQHPNIVQIHEIGTQEDIPFFSMELVTGGTLSAAMRERKIAPVVAARLLELLAKAVSYAHTRGIVHRDLKPSNVLLAPSDRKEAVDLEPIDSRSQSPSNESKYKFEPKIADFGLAKNLELDSQCSMTGSLVGTPSYMAPEQIDSALGKVGPSCDIYALGAVLYDMMVGRPPFQAATALEMMHEVRHEEPISPRRIEPKIPIDLELICLTCLRKEPARRYATAEALADDLRRFLNGQPILARSSGPIERLIKWTIRHPSLATLIAAVLLAAISTTWLWRRSEISRNSERIARQQGERLIYDRDFSVAQFEYQSHNVDRCRDILNNSRPEFRNWEWHYLNNLCNQSIWESPRDSQAVLAVSLSPDGRLVAMGRGEWGVNRPQSIDIWDNPTRYCTNCRAIPTAIFAMFNSALMGNRLSQQRLLGKKPMSMEERSFGMCRTGQSDFA
jgi:eukaryotic-like serine/threonine-protein kinase